MSRFVALLVGIAATQVAATNYYEYEATPEPKPYHHGDYEPVNYPRHYEEPSYSVQSPQPHYGGYPSEHSSRYKRQSAGYGAGYPKKDDYGRGGGSYGKSGGYSSSSGPHHVPSTFIEYVIDLKGKEGGTYEPSKTWKADCNGYSYGYEYAWITAIWDDYDFKDLDYIKCAGPKQEQGYGKEPGYKLDFYDAKLIDYTASDYSKSPHYCHKGYLLTALWADDYEFKSIKYGKCVRLEIGLVDYSTCDNFPTAYKKGGTYEAYKKWNVECPHEWAAVGMKQDYGNIEYLRCCKLIPPHPPSPKYESPKY